MMTQSKWVRPVLVGTDSEQAEENVTIRYVQLESQGVCHNKSWSSKCTYCTHHTLI